MTDESETPPAASALGQAIARLRQPVHLGNAPIDGALAMLAVPRRSPQRLLWIGLGIAAGLALILAVPALRSRDARGRDIRFVLQTPARRVALIGDFNDWDRNATPLSQRAGIWTTTVALKPGRYRYAFVLDGTRLEADPAAPAALDEFGASTSAITVGR